MNLLDETPFAGLFRRRGYSPEAAAQLSEAINAKPVQPTEAMQRYSERVSQPHNLLTMAKTGMNMAFPGVGNLLSPVANRVLHEFDMQDETAQALGDRVTDAVSPYVPAQVAGGLGAAAYTAANMFDGVPGPNPAMIAGPMARTADSVALTLAREMKAAGKSADEIFNKTGWWLDHPDGVPRFEIDDSGSMPISQKSMSWGERADFDAGNPTLVRRQKALAHPRLSAAYPETKSLGVSLRRELKDSGSYNQESGIIRVGAEKNGAANRSTMLHELQHSIQHIEDMARGGSPSDFVDAVRNELNRYESSVRSLNDRMSEIVRRKNKIAKRFDVPIDEKKAELKKLSNDYDALLEERQKIVDNIQSIEGKYGGTQEESFRRYKNLAGEVEARLVQDRMNMSMTERRKNPFYKNYDVPLESQIVRKE